MFATPQAEHAWLEQLVGEWTMEMDGGEHGTSTGTESVRSIGGLWVVLEGHATMPDGKPITSMMTVGYDPERKKYIGTWIGSVMTHMWNYEGDLDEAAGVLPLLCTGPDFEKPGTTRQYRDTITVIDDDYRTLTSHMLQDDGTWQQFMLAHYRRVK